MIIAGYGRVGTVVARIIESAGHKTTVIDYNSQQIDALRTFGAKVYYGDATRPDLLAAAGIAHAKVLVIAIDDQDHTTELARYAINTYPNLHVVARARNRHHVYQLWAAGCRDIIRETYDSSLRMGRSVLEATGVSHAKAEKMVDAFNAQDRRAMIDVADLYDPEIPAVENKPYVARIREIRTVWQEELADEMKSIRDASEDTAKPAE